MEEVDKGCLMISMGVGDHWWQIRGVMMETAQDLCGMTKGPPRHKETWWWSEEVAEAVRNKKVRYGKWKREDTEEARMEYRKSRRNARRVVFSAEEKRWKEWADDLNGCGCRGRIFRGAGRMVR